MSDEELKAPKDSKEITSEQEDGEAGWNRINKSDNDTKKIIQDSLDALRKCV